MLTFRLSVVQSLPSGIRFEESRDSSVEARDSALFALEQAAAPKHQNPTRSRPQGDEPQYPSCCALDRAPSPEDRPYFFANSSYADSSTPARLIRGFTWATSSKPFNAGVLATSSFERPALIPARTSSRAAAR